MRLIKPYFEILTDIDGGKILSNIERAGRICYKSEDKITPESAKKFIGNILQRGHESVIEHESISVRIICDRGVTHEIVRHRLCAYSQESTRYCNYKGGVTFVIPPWVDLPEGKLEDGTIQIPVKLLTALTEAGPDADWLRAMDYAETVYKKLLIKGWTPQQARSVLPNSLKTEIVMTANIREWRHVFSLRCSKAAHPQMREIMVPLRDAFRSKIPVLFEGR